MILPVHKYFCASRKPEALRESGQKQNEAWWQARSEEVLRSRLLQFIFVALSVSAVICGSSCFASDSDARVRLLQEIREQAKKFKDNEKAAEAVPLFRCAVSLVEQIYGPTDSRLESDLEDLSWSYRQDLAQFDTSEIYASRQFLLSTYNGLKGSYMNPAQEARDLELIADNYMLEGNLSCATRLYGDCVALSETANPSDSPDLLAQLSKLAWSLRKQFDNDRADATVAKLVLKIEQTFGKRPIGAAKQADEGSKHSNNGLFDLAEGSYQRALNEDIKAIGPESAWAGMDCLAIAQQALFQDKTQKANSSARRAHAIFTVACAGKSAGDSVLPLKELARAYQECGENHLAELAWQRCVSVEGPSKDSCLRGQADFFSAIGQPTKAASILEELIARYDKRSGKSPLRSSVMRALSNAYVAANNFTRAEEICKQSVANAETEKDSSTLLLALDGYSKLLKRMDRMDEAAKIQARYDELLKSDSK